MSRHLLSLLSLSLVSLFWPSFPAVAQETAAPTQEPAAWAPLEDVARRAGELRAFRAEYRFEKDSEVYRLLLARSAQDELRVELLAPAGALQFQMFTSGTRMSLLATAPEEEATYVGLDCGVLLKLAQDLRHELAPEIVEAAGVAEPEHPELQARFVLNLDVSPPSDSGQPRCSFRFGLQVSHHPETLFGWLNWLRSAGFSAEEEEDFLVFHPEAATVRLRKADGLIEEIILDQDGQPERSFWLERLDLAPTWEDGYFEPPASKADWKDKSPEMISAFGLGVVQGVRGSLIQTFGQKMERDGKEWTSETREQLRPMLQRLYAEVLQLSVFEPALRARVQSGKDWAAAYAASAGPKIRQDAHAPPGTITDPFTADEAAEKVRLKWQEATAKDCEDLSNSLVLSREGFQQLAGSHADHIFGWLSKEQEGELLEMERQALRDAYAQILVAPVVQYFRDCLAELEKF